MNQTTAERAEEIRFVRRDTAPGTRFYLARCPDQTGTITRVSDDGFEVTYDDRDIRRSRVRLHRPWREAHLFRLGVPPALKVKGSNE